MLAALHVLLVERHALLAERAGLGGVGGEVAAHQAEDLLAVDHRLLGAAPQGADADHLAAQIFHELGEQPHGGARAHQVLHDEHLGPGADEALELDGQADAPLARADPLGAVGQGGPGGMGAGHAVRQDQGAGPGGEHDVDGPLREVLGDDRPEPLREGGLGGDQGLLDVLAGVVPRRQEDVIVGVVGAGALEDLEVDLLPYLGVHLAIGLSRRRGHQSLKDDGRRAACQLESGRARLRA